jgi:hypothetical protein
VRNKPQPLARFAAHRTTMPRLAKAAPIPASPPACRSGTAQPPPDRH